MFHEIFSLSVLKKMWIIKAGICKIQGRPDQTASSVDLLCLSRPFWQATSIRNLRTFTVHGNN